MDGIVPTVVAQELSSSEDDLAWLLQTAHALLSSIKTGAEPEFDSSDQPLKDVLSDGESLHVRDRRRKGDKEPVEPIMVVSGLTWKPNGYPVMFITPHKKTPLALSSFIGLQDEGRRRAGRKRTMSLDSTISFLCPIRTSAGWQKAQSYAHLFAGLDSSSSSSSSGTGSLADHSHAISSLSSTSTSSSSSSSDHFTSTEEETSSSGSDSDASSHTSRPPYDPYFLDDPELRTGKHKTVLALPGYLGSLGHFTRAEDLKKELNDQFRQIHPNIDSSLTLSKIRKLKHLLVRVTEHADLELSTVAKSFTFFEKLVLKDLVNKPNRKLAAACCLLLATKANDSKDTDLRALIALLSEHLDVCRTDVVAAEFPVLAALHFDLFPPAHEYLPHMERILVSLDYSNIQEYLGERMYIIWKRDV